MAERVETPLTAERARSLKAGDIVMLWGSVLIARDAAHKRLVEAIKRGERVPFSLEGETIFYAGPAPTPPGAVIGPIGPTTSGRMDPYTPFLIERGLRGMIGKGRRSREVLDSMQRHGAVYFGATGGTAVLIADKVVSVEKVAYDDLGPEAILRLDVKDLPLVVLADSHGNDIYVSGPEEARKLMGV
jgi:fumarate hydratase subunit beta